jgi:two-component sensor histidine kinase
MSAPIAEREKMRASVPAEAGESFSIDFGISLRTPFMTRMMVRFILSEWQIAPEAVDVAVLLASELATNAVKSGPAGPARDGYVPYITVALRHSAGVAVIEVSDENEDPPELQNADPESDGGRGLILVQALSREWSYYQPRRGWKTVFCVIDAPAGPAA